jgi:predicted nucleic acid-binding Zn ribbon protein
MKFRFRNFRSGKTVEFHEVLPEIIKELDVDDSFVIIQLKQNWEKITGNIISAHSTPEKIFGKKLFVSVDHPVYANEISLMKNSLLQRMNQILGSELVNDIKADVKKSRWKKQGQ